MISYNFEELKINILFKISIFLVDAKNKIENVFYFLFYYMLISNIKDEWLTFCSDICCQKKIKFAVIFDENNNYTIITNRLKLFMWFWNNWSIHDKKIKNNAINMETFRECLPNCKFMFIIYNIKGSLEESKSKIIDLSRIDDDELIEYNLKKSKKIFSTVSILS